MERAWQVRIDYEAANQQVPDMTADYLASGGRAVIVLIGRRAHEKEPRFEILLAGIDADDVAIAEALKVSGGVDARILGVLTEPICAQWNLHKGQVCTIAAAWPTR